MTKAKIFPRVPCRQPDGRWRVYYVPKTIVSIINREELPIELRRLNAQCLQGTAERKEWLKLHVALTIELETETGFHLRRNLDSLRSRLHHLVGWSPVLGDRPKGDA